MNFLILPLFAFANAGARIKNPSFELISQPLFLGIALGLFLGKQIGVMMFSFIACRLKITYLPRGASWAEFCSAAIFTGICFTMSLFIAALAFGEKLTTNKIENLLLDEAKLAILTSSVLSIFWGTLVIFLSKKFRTKKI